MSLVRRAVCRWILVGLAVAVVSSTADAQLLNLDEIAGRGTATGQAATATNAVVSQRDSFYRRAAGRRMATPGPTMSAAALGLTMPRHDDRLDAIPGLWFGDRDGTGPVQQAAPFEAETDLGVYLNANVALTNSTGNLATLQLGYSSTSYGFTLGADHRFSDTFVGDFSVAYNRDDAGLGIAGNTNSNAVQAIFAGSFTPTDGLWFDAVLSAGWLGMTLNRPTPVGQATGNPDAPQLWAGVSGGYDFSLASATLTPYGRVNGSSTWFQGYRETGPGAALFVGKNTFWSVTTVLGLQASYVFSTDAGVIAPYIRAEYVHDFGNAPTSQIIPFAGPGVGTILIAPGPVPDRDFFNVGGGLSTHLARGWAAFADYDGVFGYTNLTRHAVTVGVHKEF